MMLVGPTANAVAANPPHFARGLGRAHVTNDPAFLPKRAMGPFAQARRRRDLVDAFTAALGGEDALSAVAAMYVRRAAELLTMAEMARAAMLNGQPTDMLALVRLEGAASRAVRLLGVKIATPPPGLQRARARWDAQRQPENTKTTKAAKADRREKPPQQRRVRRPGHDPTQETD
jgi:hypothetical protein